MKFKRILALLLTLTMTFSLSGNLVLAEDISAPITDGAPADSLSENPESEPAPEATPLPIQKDYQGIINEALEKISAGYTNSTSDWIVMEMGAYRNYAPNTANILSADIEQSYINNSITVLAQSTKDTDLDKAILGLMSIGKDPKKLYPVNSNTPINSLERLNAAQKSASSWAAPYTLAVYSHFVEESSTYIDELISALLSAQTENGSRNEWDSTIDTTSNALAGLALYGDRPEVSTAIDNALEYLSTQQAESGAFSEYGSENANTTAIAVIALCACGVNLTEDTRFIKNGNNALDGLLSFLTEELNAFRFKTTLTSADSYATEQGFRALIAAASSLASGSAYNIYSFSYQNLTPARANGGESSSSPSAPAGDNISVTVTIKSDSEYWLNNYRVTLPGEGATVYHAFQKACDENSISAEGAESGYVSSITKGNKTLSAFSKGENSGWLYKVNGQLPEVGLTDFAIFGGDEITWYFTEDWKKDPSAGGHSSIYTPAIDNDEESSDISTIQKLPILYEGKTFSDITSSLEKEKIEALAQRGIISGMTEDTFEPSKTMTRAEFATITVIGLGIEAGGENIFSDVAENSWYKDYVSAAYENGIVAGISQTEFNPEGTISKEEAAAMLCRAAALLKIEKTYDEDAVRNILCAFSDYTTVSDWAKEALAFCYDNEVLDSSDMYILPQNAVTRAEIADMLYNLLVKAELI